ncbi:MAG: secretin N-terminal domain-containing protein, partial [Planctomycetota bacterium]
MVSARRTRWIRLSILALGLGMGGGLPALVPDARAEDEPPEARPAPEAEAVPEAVPVPEADAVPEAEVEEGPSRPALDFPDAGLIERDDGTILYFYYTNFVTPADLKSSLEGLLQVPGVQLKEFGQQNALLLEGEPEAVEIAIEAAAYFDVPAPQVFIEARVVEITYSSNFEFGLDYLMSRDPIGPNTLFRGAEGTLNPSSFIQSTLPGGLPFQGSSLLFGFVGEKAQK